MEINKDTKIKYEILDKRSKEKSFITVSMEQIASTLYEVILDNPHIFTMKNI